MTVDWVPVRRLADVRTGKIVNSEPSSAVDIEAPYVTAANVQPQGRVMEIEGKTMWFTPKELTGPCGLRGGDLLVVEGGAGFGRPGTVPDEFDGWGFQNHINRIRPREDMADARFLYYVFEHILSSGETAVIAQGATFPTLSSEKVRGIRVPLWSLELQQDIVAFLDRETVQIDAMIDAQQRLVELLAERRSALADRLALGTLSEGTGGPSRELDLLGTHLAVAPALATIPATWNVVRFKTALERLEERNIGAQHIMMSLKSTGEVVERSSLGERQEPDPESIPRYLVAHPGDLVVNPMWLTGGAIGVSQVTGAVSPDYRVFRTRGEHDPRYLHHLLRTRPYFDQYQLYTRAQTTFDRRVQQDDLDNLPLPVPPMSEQSEIARRIDEHSGRLDQLIFESRRSIDLLRERRAALITAAVTGVLDPRTGVERLDVILEEAGV